MNKTTKKIIAMIMMAIIFICSFANIKLNAQKNEPDIPTIKVKSVNSGTAIKITINKTKKPKVITYI